MDALPSRRREAVLGSLILVGAAVAVALGVAARERATTADLIAREDAALALVERVMAAEEAHHAATGSYGWIADLHAAGRLPGLEVATRDGRAVVLGDGYRLDVLLPMNRLRIIPDGGPAPDPDLKRRHVAVVARPLDPGVSGHRIWYLDERGDVYAGEGIVDPEARARNPLPEWPPTVGGPGAAASRISWQLVRPRKEAEPPPGR